MESDNLEIKPDSFEDMSKKFESFDMNEMELMNFLALQVENVLVPVLQKYQVYYYVQAANDVAEELIKHTQTFCNMKRGNK